MTGRRHRRWPQRSAGALCAALLLFGAGAGGASAAPSIWDLQQQAQADRNAGDLRDAAHIWQQLLRLLAPATDAGGYTNEAIYNKDLGHYWLRQGDYQDAVAAFDREAKFWALAGHASWGDEDEQIAGRYRTDVRVFVRRRAPGGAGTGALYAPADGAYLGFYVGRGSVRGLPVLGRDGSVRLVHPAIRLHYLNWGAPLPQAWLAAAASTGTALEIALQPMGGLGQVLSGTGYAERLAGRLAGPVPVFLRFAGEMNGDWTAWGMMPSRSAAFQAHAARYVRAFREVAGVMHQDAPNVAMVWAPNDLPSTGTGAYWPGAAYVDWVGVSAYLDWSAPGKPGANAQGNLLADISWVYDHYAARKPIMVAEGAVGNRDFQTGRDLTAWAEARMQTFFAALPRLYPDIKAFVWWSASKPEGGGGQSDYRLRQGSGVTAAFARDTAIPWFLKRWGATAPFVEVPLGARLSGDVHLSAYVHFWEPAPSRVTYTLDGGPVGSASEPPYRLHLDLSGVAPGRHVLAVTVYGRGGNADVTKDFVFTVPQPSG